MIVGSASCVHIAEDDARTAWESALKISNLSWKLMVGLFWMAPIGQRHDLELDGNLLNVSPRRLIERGPLFLAGWRERTAVIRQTTDLRIMKLSSIYFTFSRRTGATRKPLVWLCFISVLITNLINPRSIKTDNYTLRVFIQSLKGFINWWIHSYHWLLYLMTYYLFLL